MNERFDNGILTALRCPCCNSEMTLENDGKSLKCSAPKRHCFDFASSGYVNISSSHGGGDSKEAVRSRTRFLDSGHYKPISDAMRGILSRCVPQGGLIVDAGCGEGYYSCRVSGAGYSVCEFDLSKVAADQAAKRARREGLSNTLFGVASVFELPMADSSADAVMNIFAPCAEREYCRILKDGGILAVAYAGPEHLMGLKKKLYDRVYTNEERSDMPKDMKLLEEIRVRYDITLSGAEQITDLFAMTPYYWRTSQSDKDKLLGLDSLTTEADVIIAVYKK